MSEIFPSDINPESLFDTNRANDTRMDGDSPKEITITLEDIDSSVITYLKTIINPTVTENEKSIQVPIIYANPERWATIQKDGFIRDPKNDKLQSPLISLRRVSISRDNMTNPSNKYLHRTFTKQWNKRNIYDRFAVQNQIKPSEQIRTIVIPDYVNIDYEIIMWTDYESQMNQIIEQINFENEEWWGLRNDFKFRTRISEYNKDSRLPPTTDRIVRTNTMLRVFGYLLPSAAISNFKPSQTNKDIFTRKKIITFVEVEETG